MLTISLSTVKREIATVYLSALSVAGRSLPIKQKCSNKADIAGHFVPMYLHEIGHASTKIWRRINRFLSVRNQKMVDAEVKSL